MKQIFSLLALILAYSASAQLILEHTYPGEARRVKLEKSGEKYYTLDEQNQLVALYNKDHSLWQEIHFPADTNGKVIRLFELSETKIIPDNAIELVYLYDGGVDGLFLRIMNETGKIYFSQPLVSTFELSIFPGQPSKLITTNGLASTEIFSIPSLLSEHVFSGNNAKRILLDNGEVKYFYASSTELYIYNADYSLYKTATLPAWFQGSSATVEHASQMSVNTDGLLEIALRRSNGPAILINENGNELKRSSSGFLTVSVFPGYPDKLVLNDTVFSLPGLSIDHIYSKFYPFRVLAESGPKFLMGWGDSIRGYDANHNLFINIKVPHSYNFFLSNLYNYSEKIFNSDNKLELLYRVVNVSSDSAASVGRICNQDQAVLFEEIDANYFVVSQIGGGLQNKLLSYISNWGEAVYQTNVYGLPSYDYTAVDETENRKPEIDLCPNPASTRFLLCGASDQKYLVTVSDISGTQLREQELMFNQEFNLTGLSKGIYIVNIASESGHKTTRKLVIN